MPVSGLGIRGCRQQTGHTGPALLGLESNGHRRLGPPTRGKYSVLTKVVVQVVRIEHRDLTFSMCQGKHPWGDDLKLKVEVLAM